MGGTAEAKLLSLVFGMKVFFILLFKRGMRNLKLGRFGIHGGQYLPEILMNAVIKLEEA